MDIQFKLTNQYYKQMKRKNILSTFGLSLALLCASCTADDNLTTTDVSAIKTTNASTNITAKTAGSTKQSISATTASAQHSGSYAASNATDGNLSTRWTASGTLYLYLDMGSSKLIDYLKIAHYGLRKYNIEISTSNSLTSGWVSKGTFVTAGTSTALVDYELTNSTARYVRIACTGNTSDAFSNITEVEVWGGTATATSSYPAGVLGITSSTWKINSHTGSPSNSTYWDDITESGATFSTYSDANYFYTDGTWTYFKCYRGAGTSSSSQNPRVELREKINGNDASWNGSSGTHTMTWTVKVNKLPKGSDGSSGVLCFGQIHGPSTNANGVKVDDIIRVQFLGTANQSTGSCKLKISGYVTETVLGGSKTYDGYSLATEYTFTIKYFGGKVYLYNGSTLVFSQAMDTSTEGNYFKVGNYLQSVKGSSYDGSFGLVAVKNLSVTHS